MKKYFSVFLKKNVQRCTHTIIIMMIKRKSKKELSVGFFLCGVYMVVEGKDDVWVFTMLWVVTRQCGYSFEAL